MNWITDTKPFDGQSCLIKTDIYGIHQATYQSDSDTFDLQIAGAFITLTGIAWMPIEEVQ